jgi:prevent-host-death family protein
VVRRSVRRSGPGTLEGVTTHVVNVDDAEPRLSELIREAEAGVQVILARNGRPVARIVPWLTSRPARVLGAWSGRVAYHDDVVGHDESVAAMFEQSAAGER